MQIFSSTHSCLLEAEIIIIVTVGIDLAKNVFAVHGVDTTGKPVLLRPSVARLNPLRLQLHDNPLHRTIIKTP
jgi:hypothetical protein